MKKLHESDKFAIKLLAIFIASAAFGFAAGKLLAILLN